MVRAQFKDKAYFDEYIDFSLDAVNDLKNEPVVDSDQEKVNRLKSGFFLFSFPAIIAMFSRGDDIATIKDYFVKEYLNNFCVGWEHLVNAPGPANKFSLDSYFQILTTLSLAILLDIDIADFKKIVEVMDKMGKSDYLLDYMVSHKISERNKSSEVLYKTNYGEIVNATQVDAKEAAVIIKRHLDTNWYKSFKDAYWYNDHKSANDAYFGYWSFEAAALVRIMTIDDSDLKKNTYYPYDIVHG